jgi:hypothetical protein
VAVRLTVGDRLKLANAHTTATSTKTKTISGKTGSIVVHQRLALGWRFGAALSHGEESSAEESHPGQGDCRNEALVQAAAVSPQTDRAGLAADLRPSFSG